ncbi:MAG: hypothetical protein JXA30_21455 [Deltaproteobacteria bacterium]|nr:hypothetical protein [Deltaproteobacteria bacterium]
MRSLSFLLSSRKVLLLFGLALAALVLIFGKQREGRALRCRFGPEYRVFNSRNKLIDAIALVAFRKEQAVAFWSDADGLYGRRLDENGEALGRAIPIDSRCRGGIDAVADARAIYLACLRRSNQDANTDAREVDFESRAGSVTVYGFSSELDMKWARIVGSAGPMSKGVGISLDRQGLLLAWHDGSRSEQSVWFVRLDASRGVTPRVISRNKGLAGAPSIFQGGGEPKIVWAETWVHKDELEGEIMLSDGRSSPYALIDVHYHAATPRLLELNGELILAYRDQRTREETPGIYAARLGKDERIVGEPVRIARADTEERPSLSSCFNGVVTAAPRTYGHDRMVGVNWFDASLSKLGGEQQFCEDTREFSLAASACMGSRALLLIGERGSSTQEYTAIRSATFWCSL